MENQNTKLRRTRRSKVKRKSKQRRSPAAGRFLLSIFRDSRGCQDHLRSAFVWEFAGFEVVGAKGFEPSTSWSRTRRASQAALRPDRVLRGRIQSKLPWIAPQPATGMSIFYPATALEPWPTFFSALLSAELPWNRAPGFPGGGGVWLR